MSHPSLTKLSSDNPSILGVRHPEFSSLDQSYLVASSRGWCVRKTFRHMVIQIRIWATFSLTDSSVGGSDSCFGALASVCQGLAIHLAIIS